MSVKVAVRVRPFNSREIDLQSKLIIEMNNNTTKITDVQTNEKRDFTFDYSFWSHDGFETDPNVNLHLNLFLLSFIVFLGFYEIFFYLRIFIVFRDC